MALRIGQPTPGACQITGAFCLSTWPCEPVGKPTKEQASAVRGLVGVLPAWPHPDFLLLPSCPTSLHRSAFKVGTFLNSKRLVLNIANDIACDFRMTSTP